MKVKEGVSIRKIGQENILVSDSDSLDYTRVISLNNSAVFLLESVGKDEFTNEKLIELLLCKYAVSREQAASDVEKLVQSLYNAGVIL